MGQLTKIKLYRGNYGNLPILADGEPGFARDTGQLFIGNGTTNVLIAGAEVADGDKGDVTVSDAGEEWTINDEVISLANLESGIFPIAEIRHQANDTTGGGTSSANTWQTRVLNSIWMDTGVGVTLNTNVVTVPAGKYEIEANAPIYDGLGHQLRLVTSGATPSNFQINGTSEFCSTTQTRSYVFFRMDSTTSFNITLQHWCNQGFATVGLGVNTNNGDGVNVYAQLRIRKIP